MTCHADWFTSADLHCPRNSIASCKSGGRFSHSFYVNFVHQIWQWLPGCQQSSTRTQRLCGWMDPNNGIHKCRNSGTSGNYISSSNLIDGFVTDSAGTIIASDLNDTISNVTPFAHTFFTGLSLGPGAYYFILAPPTFTTTAAWYTDAGTVLVLSPGTTFSGSYETVGGSLNAPLGVPYLGDNSITFQFQIAGTVAPEPDTIGTIVVGGIGIALMLRRRRSWPRPWRSH